jgi:CBS domain-containing protein
MKVHEIMTSEVAVAKPNESLASAARTMRTLDVGALPVFDGERLVGILTDRDITIRSVAAGSDPETTPVSSSMSADVIFCFEDHELHEAEWLMQEHQVRRLPVLNREKRLVGIVSLGDFATRSHERQFVGQTLERISEPHAVVGMEAGFGIAASRAGAIEL